MQKFGFLDDFKQILIFVHIFKVRFGEPISGYRSNIRKDNDPLPVLAGTQEDFLGLRRGEKGHLAFLLRQSWLSIGPCSLQKEKMHL